MRANHTIYKNLPQPSPLPARVVISAVGVVVRLYCRSWEIRSTNSCVGGYVR